MKKMILLFSIIFAWNPEIQSMVEIKNWKELIKASTLEQEDGIRIVQLTNENESGFYLSEMPAGSYGNACYHNHDAKTYQIVKGSGVLHNGTILSDGNMYWRKSQKIKAGDFFIIKPGMIYQVHNNSHDSLVVLFGCPKTQLETDRYLVENHPATSKK
jgi:mannose-6-phosphate isomerase-like protein (cupin superfamily)